MQISHMSLVPSLTISRLKRDTLNNRRNTFTYIANLLVLILAFILFISIRYILLHSKSIFINSFVSNPQTIFEVLAIIVTSIGFFTSLFFTIVIDEKYLTAGIQYYYY